jgi:RNA polymerase sigma-70 factor, ECF subfamily
MKRSTADWDWSQIRLHCLREARRHTRNDADAEDVAQAAALRAWRRRHALRDPDALWLWLSSITRNEAMRLYERRRPESRAEIPDRPHDPNMAEKVALRLDVAAAVSRLPVMDQRLIALHYGQDMTSAAAAKALSMHASTAKVRLHRIRGRLARSLTSV